MPSKCLGPSTYSLFTRVLGEDISNNYGSLVQNSGRTETKQYRAHHAPPQHYSYYQVSETNTSSY